MPLVSFCVSHWFSFHSLQNSTGVRRFTKPPESLERSLEMSRHRGRKRAQKRPNYKNLGEEEEEDRPGPGEEGWEDGGGGGEREREREKSKGSEGGCSKGGRTSGETEGEWECLRKGSVCVSHRSASIIQTAPSPTYFFLPSSPGIGPALQTG